MTSRLVYFILSLIASFVIVYLYGKLRSGGINDRKMRGFLNLCVVAPFWIMFNAFAVLYQEELFTPFFYLKMVCVCIIPFVSCWFFLNFIESRAVRSRFLKTAFIAVPALDIVALLSNPWHKLYFTDIIHASGRTVEGVLFYIHLVLITISVMATYIVLTVFALKRIRQNPLLLLVAVGAMSPFILNMLYTFRVLSIGFDLTPVGYFLTIVVFTYFAYISGMCQSREELLNQTLIKISKTSALYAGNAEEMTRVISQESCRALDISRVGIWSADEEAGLLRSTECFDSEKGFTTQENLRMGSNKEQLKLLAAQRLIEDEKICETLITAEVAKNHAPNMCAMLSTPIHIDGSLAWVIFFEQDCCDDYPKKRKWTKSEKIFVTSIADFFVLAITNAEKMRMAAELKEALQKAAEASKAKADFLSQMSHELLTPMNSIIGMTEIALRDETQAAKDEHILEVKRAGANLLSIINEILDFTKKEEDARKSASEGESAESAPGDEPSISFTAPNARVLIVDDIYINLMVAEGSLAPYKMHVDLRSGGIEAVDAVMCVAGCADQYDLVIMDYMMPGVDGKEATRRIRDAGIDIPIIALTANTVPDVMEMLLNSGFNDYLYKPIDPVKLNTVLEKWLPKEKQLRKA